MKLTIIFITSILFIIGGAILLDVTILTKTGLALIILGCGGICFGPLMTELE